MGGLFSLLEFSKVAKVPECFIAKESLLMFSYAGNKAVFAPGLRGRGRRISFMLMQESPAEKPLANRFCARLA